MARTALVILAISTLPLSGCGTFSDALCGPVIVPNNPVYYRGVRLDVEAVREGGMLTLLAADIPLSAVADTLLVPYLAYQELTQIDVPAPAGLQSPGEEGTNAGKPSPSLPQSGRKE